MNDRRTTLNSNYLRDISHNVLGHLEKKPVRQALTQSKERYCDGFDCEDGSTVWFDITVPHGDLSRRFK
jgi:hypothetical protein